MQSCWGKWKRSLRGIENEPTFIMKASTEASPNSRRDAQCGNGKIILVSYTNLNEERENERECGRKRAEDFNGL